MNYNSLQLLNMLCELSLLFNKKEGVEEQFPEVVGNSHYENYGITLIGGNYTTSGRQINFSSVRKLYFPSPVQNYKKHGFSPTPVNYLIYLYVPTLAM